MEIIIKLLHKETQQYHVPSEASCRCLFIVSEWIQLNLEAKNGRVMHQAHGSRLIITLTSSWRWGRQVWLADWFRLCQLIWDACVHADGRWSCESDSAALSQHLAGLWTHTHTHTRVLTNIANRPFPPEQVDKRDRLQSGGINSIPAHTHHTSMISDVDSGGGGNSSSCFGFIPVGINAKRWRGWRGRPMKVKREVVGWGVGGGVLAEQEDEKRDRDDI